MKHFFKYFLYAIALGLFATSCSTDEDDSAPAPRGDYDNGILISHEGNFGQPNASVSYVSDDLSVVENNIFNNVNNSVLGNTAQSIGFNEDLAYIVLNGSNTIEVVNRYTFQSVASITTGLSNPRNIAFANNFGYVTNWGDGNDSTDDYLAIIDLSTHTMTSNTIAVEEGPEAIIAYGNTVYVAHQGGFSQNNIVSVVDANSNAITTTIVVGDRPNSLQIDNQGNLWVLAGGNPAWTGNETAGRLSKINTTNNAVTAFDFQQTEHPKYLNFSEGELFYFNANSVYKMTTNAASLPTESELSVSDINIYGMGIKDNKLYALDAADFSSDGSMFIYDLDTGNLINSFNLNVIPSKVYFN